MATAMLSKALPGPRSLPLAGWRGNLLAFVLDPIAAITRLHQRYGPVVALARNHPELVMAFGPVYNQQLLTDPQLFYSSSLDLNALGFQVRHDTPWYRTATGLLSMNGVRHNQQRRLMLPAFHKKSIERYRDDMVNYTERMLIRWQQAGSAAPHDMMREMRQLTLLIACQTLFGVDVSHDVDNVGHTLEHWIAANASPLLGIIPWQVPGSPYRRVQQVSAALEAQLTSIIAQKRASSQVQHDVLALLLAARDEDGTALSDDELIGEATVLFLAGHETSANALTWTLFLLGQHPHVLANLLDELDGVLHGSAPTVEQLAQLPLLERVIKESMRLLPPVTLSQRISTAPFALGPYELPRHSVVMFSPYLTHRLPELYPQPQRFLPQRWEQLSPSPYAYLPFGAGSRMCIGATFAMMEIKIVLALLLQRFRLALVPNALIDRQVMITLFPKHGLPMRVLPQDRQFTAVPVRGNIHSMVEMP